MELAAVACLLLCFQLLSEGLVQVVLQQLEEREAVAEEASCHCLLALVPHRDLPVSCASAVALRLRPRPREEEGGRRLSLTFVSLVLVDSS